VRPTVIASRFNMPVLIPVISLGAGADGAD
jgi:hypothetical protein